MNWFLGIDATTGVLVADFEDTATGLNHPVTGITAIPTGGGWHHAAVTYDTATDTWNLYLDGILDATSPSADFTPESSSIQHGALGTALNSTGVPPASSTARLMRSAIWNVARTGAQILAGQGLSSSPAAPAWSPATALTRAPARALAARRGRPTGTPSMARSGSPARRSAAATGPGFQH